MNSSDTNGAHALALNALVWVLGEPDRAERFLALTGLQGKDIRARIDDPALLDAVVGYLEGHEPDLVACARTLEVTPTTLLNVRGTLGR